MITLIVVLGLIGLAVAVLSRKLRQANDKKLEKAFSNYYDSPREVAKVTLYPALPGYSTRSYPSSPSTPKSKPKSYSSSSSSSSSSSYSPSSFDSGSSSSGSSFGGGDSGGGGSSSDW